MVVVNNTTAGKIIPTIVKNLYRIQQVFRTEPVFHLYKVIYASFLLKCHFFIGSLKKKKKTICNFAAEMDKDLYVYSAFL